MLEWATQLVIGARRVNFKGGLINEPFRAERS
jgi:hypothetical protein